MKIVSIVGSPRPKGNTSYLVDQALKETAIRGFETEKYILSQYRVAACQGHDNCASFTVCKRYDDAPWILNKFCDAEGIILASPVYFYNVTAEMKAFIDRSYFQYTHKIRLKALCVGLIVVGGGGGVDHTVRALLRFLKLSSDIPNDRIIVVRGYANKSGEVKNNLALVKEARTLGRLMSEILACDTNLA
jgi:multimeric flavodoxin WrbA